MRVTTANLKYNLSTEQRKKDLLRILKNNPDVVGLQEVNVKQLKQLKGFLAAQGYGVVFNAESPIIYDKSKYNLKASNGIQITSGTATHGNKRPIHVSWAALVDKETGKTSVFTNTHLTNTANGSDLHKRQIRDLAELQRSLMGRFDQGEFFLMGDLNEARRSMLAPLTNLGLNFHAPAHGTGPHGGQDDWIGSTMSTQFGGQIYDNLNTDHGVFTLGGFAGGTRGGPRNGIKKDEHDFEVGPQIGPPSKEKGAFKILKDFFEGLGIEYDSQIEDVIKGAMKDGYGPDQISLIMPDLEKTRAFNKRFVGYAKRVKNGYNAVSIGEYLDLENQYHRIMQEAGLPKGFYDRPDDFGNFIANNVSANEVAERVKIATDAAKQVDPTMRNLLARYYGLTPGDVASYFLDSKRALPVIEKQYQTAGVATWAKRAGLDVGNRKHYEDLVDKGITDQQAAQGYGTIAAFTDSVGAAARIYGEDYTQRDAENDVFFNDNEKRRRIMSKEIASFSGNSQGRTGTSQRQSY